MIKYIQESKKQTNKKTGSAALDIKVLQVCKSFYRDWKLVLSFIHRYIIKPTFALQTAYNFKTDTAQVSL